jgi:dUTP pyrophosphatase
MQYQVFKTDGELVAWLDTETKDAILKRGYEIQEGKDLRIREVIEKGMQNPKVVAKFEKVTWGQYCASRGCDPANVFTEPYAQEYDNIKIPKRATTGSAGYDFFAPFDFSLVPGATIKIPTGIRCILKEGFVLKEYPRSGLGFKYRVRLDNTVGIIDSDYYKSDNGGHIFIKITNEGQQILKVKQGEAFCQGIIVEHFYAEEDEVTEQRNGGIGSTSK